MYDYDLLDKDDEIGRGSYPLKELDDGEEKEVWMEIKEEKPEKQSSSVVSTYQHCHMHAYV